MTSPMRARRLAACGAPRILKARPAALALAGLVAALAGCQSANLDGGMQGFGKGDRCINDSKQCLGERSSALNELMLDKKNTWIHQKPSAESYAAGVRLFAYKTKKRQLTCAELAAGVREADAAPNMLRGGAGSHLPPGHVSRGLILASEVSRELKRESQRRCGRSGA